jgi:hypothetical protein
MWADEENGCLPGAMMNSNLKVIIAVVGAVVLAAAFSLLVWKLAPSTGVN